MKGFRLRVTSLTWLSSTARMRTRIIYFSLRNRCTLQESVRGLLCLAPPHAQTMADTRRMCERRAQHPTTYSGERLEQRLFSSAGGDVSPARACYTLEVGTR